MEATLRRSSSVGGLFYPRRFLTAARPVGWRVDAHVKERGGRNPTELSRRSAPKTRLGRGGPRRADFLEHLWHSDPDGTSRECLRACWARRPAAEWTGVEAKTH